MWSGGRGIKECFIQRAKDAAAVSLPHLAPLDEGETSTGESYPQRYSGRAGRGVVNLASKLTTGLFPPTAPFVKFEPDLTVFVEQFGEDEDKLDELALALSRRERAIDAFMDGHGWRARSFPMFMQLLVAGNYLLEQMPNGRFVGRKLDKYQVDRDGLDRVRSITIREAVPIGALKGLIKSTAKPGGVPGKEDHALLWTRAEVVDESLDADARMWKVWQEVGEGIPVKGAAKNDVKNADLPYIPVRLFQSDDEPYGRSLFDLIQGEVEVVEGLTQALAEDAALVANGIWRIDPASGVDSADFEKKRAGQSVYAKDGQIGMIRADKGGDLQFAAQLHDTMDRELSAIFLSFLPRDSERTTAAEIQRMTLELNEAFGGAFSLLALELQLPAALLTEKRMIALGKLKKLSDPNLARPKIVTGIDAIGRGREEIAMESFLISGQAVLGQEQMANRLKVGNLLNRFAASKGIDPEGIILSDEEFAAAEQQRQQQAAVQGALPNIVNAAVAQQDTPGG